MPDTNNSQIRGPPGPPGPRLGGPPKQDGSIWPRGPSGGGGWGNDMPDGQMGYGGRNGSSGGGAGWGDLDTKRESSVWPDSASTSGWNCGPRNPVGPANEGMHRSSPGWGTGEDSNIDGPSGWPSNHSGIKGGAGGDTSVANGTSVWGPPPSGGAGSASASSWGATPPPNPVASAAWGAPGPGMSPGQGNKPQSGKILVPFRLN